MFGLYSNGDGYDDESNHAGYEFGKDYYKNQDADVEAIGSFFVYVLSTVMSFLMYLGLVLMRGYYMCNKCYARGPLVRGYGRNYLYEYNGSIEPITSCELELDAYGEFSRRFGYRPDQVPSSCTSSRKDSPK